MIRSLIKRVVRDDRGTSAVELGIILAVIFLAMLGALSSLAGVTNSMWKDVSSKSNAATSSAS